MKKLNILILFVLSMVLFTCLMTAQIFSAEDEDDDDPFVLVSYYVEDNLKVSERCVLGKGIEIAPAKSSYTDRTFYGWFSEDGTLYEAGQKVQFTKDTKLYEAWGGTAGTRDELQSKIGKSWYYTKLTADITSTSRFSLPWGVAIIDLNGFSININTTSNNTHAFAEQRAGLIIVGDGEVNFNSTAPNLSTVAFCSLQRHGFGDGGQRLWIGKDVTINAPGVALVQVTNDMSGTIGYPTINIHGTVSCSMIARTAGAKIAQCNIYEGAVVDVNGPYMFTDSSYYDENVMNINFYGGEIYMGEETEIAQEYGKYNIDLAGGLYNKNLAHLITTRYRCSKLPNEMYEITENLCYHPLSTTGYHRYKALEITVDCDHDGIIIYECMNCHDIYELERRSTGHILTKQMTKPVVNTPEATSAGEYTTSCERCNLSFTELIYPDPSTTYITLKARQKGREYTFRAPASDFFLYNPNEKGENVVLKVFMPHGVNKVYIDGVRMDFAMEEIFSVEIPLGTVTLQGTFKTNTTDETGVFYHDQYIEEVFIPDSVTTIGPYAFAEMASIKNIVGIENATTLIDQYAFLQLENSPLHFKELVINARTINQYAFGNVVMDTLRIERNVSSINGNAFNVPSGVTKVPSGLKEILLDALKDYDDIGGRTLSQLNSTYNFFTSCPNSGDFSTILAYNDHTYEYVDFPATCVRGRYTAVKCTQCQDERIENTSQYRDPNNHTYFEDYDVVPSTCTRKGGNYLVCQDCGFRYRDGDEFELNPDNHVLVKEHVYVVGEDGKSKDCTVEHMDRHICTEPGCGYIEDEAKWVKHAQESHHFSVKIEDASYEATCGAEGLLTEKCSRCDITQETVLPTTGRHSNMEDESQHVDPTCVAEGKTVYICKVCGTYLGTHIEPIDPEAHNWKITEGEPNTETGYIEISYTCLNNCGTEHVATAEEPHGRYDPALIQAKATEGDGKLPVWVIILIVVGGIVLVVGVASTIYFTIFKKKNKSRKFKYNFNTLNKK